MKVRAHDLTVTLRAILGTLPGATAIGLHAFENWTLVLITAASDEAAIMLSEDLGLGATTVIAVDDRWWRRATLDLEGGSLRVVVTGPLQVGPAPWGAAEKAPPRSK